MNLEKYRTEWKYSLSQTRKQMIINKIINVMKKDSNSSNDGCYYVHSLYFDSLNMNDYNDTDDGNEFRKKYRIRYYNDDLSTLKLECKIKRQSMGYKKSCCLLLSEYNMIMNGEYENLLFKTNKDILKQFCIESILNLYRPKIYVFYKRTAFVDDVSNIRITFDENISYSKNVQYFLCDNKEKIPIIYNDDLIMEVKFDYQLPNYYREMIDNLMINQSSFSKYYLCIKKSGGCLL